MRDSTRAEKIETAPGFTDGGLFGPYKFLRLKSGRKMTFWDAIREAESAQSSFVRGMSRGFKLMATEFDLQTLEDRVARMEEYTASLRRYIEKKRGEQKQRERIALLRNTMGRTPEEADEFKRKADELEAALDG
jgi:hypothetical protein